jgi:hypothetical protein
VVRFSTHELCAHNSLESLIFLFLSTLGLVSTKDATICFLVAACHSALSILHEDMHTLGFGGDLHIPFRSLESLFNIFNISGSSDNFYFLQQDPTY